MACKYTTIALLFTLTLSMGCGTHIATVKDQSQKVVFIGDSITFCWSNSCFGDTPLGLAAVWPNAVNKGIPGQTSAQILSRFQQDVIDEHPAVVVIECFCNDITPDMTPETAADVLLSVKPNILSMIRMAESSNIRVVLTSTTPNSFSPVGSAYWQWTQDYNAFAADIAQHDSHIAFADYYPLLADSHGLGLPGIFAGDNCCHPGPVGQAIMAPVLTAAITGALSR
jgi:acyl-CoA thioesterase I